MFVWERATGVTRRVSLSSTGAQAKGGSEQPAISATGRYVAFVSSANNLDGGTLNRDVFVRDLVAGTTRLVSVSNNDAEGNRGSFVPAISADGRHVAFASDASNLVSGDTNDDIDVIVRDLAARVTRRVSVSSDRAQGNRISTAPTISAHGRFVAFESDSSNLAPGKTQGTGVFVHVRAP